jgi:hypothetical protein
MGAYGFGCLDELPVFVNIDDVPNDQGRQVRFRWLRSSWDAPGDTVDVESYEVYRYQGDFAAARVEDGGPPSLVDGWDYIASAPAHGDSIYQLVGPTLCDSTIAGGQCWSRFFVRAVTTDRFLSYDSPVDSGYSVDNLAPASRRHLPSPMVRRGETRFRGTRCRTRTSSTTRSIETRKRDSRRRRPTSCIRRSTSSGSTPGATRGITTR